MNDFQKSLIAMKIQEAQKKPCILCGKKADAAGVFIPDNPEFAAKIGQPKGKTRLCVYSICDRCHKKSDWMERVEQSMLADVLAATGNKQN